MEREVAIDAVLARRDVFSIIIGGKAYEIKRERTPPTCICGWGRVAMRCNYAIRALCAAAQALTMARGPENCSLPCPARSSASCCRKSRRSKAGQGVVVVEAMKMQNEIKSPKKGVVRKIVAAEGAAVNAGDVLAVVE